MDLLGGPLVFTIFMIAVALVIQSDAAQRTAIGPLPLPELPPWAIIEHAEAITTLSVITTIMATALAILYSALFLLVTLASMQFSPRLLHATTRYRALQVCTGACLGTLTYCLVMLSLLGPDDESSHYYGVLLGVGLAIISIFILLFTVAYTSRNVQINYIIDRISRETERAITTRMKERVKVTEPDSRRENVLPLYERSEVELRADSSGYLQAVHFEQLEKIARKESITIDIKVKIGEYVTKDVALLGVRSLQGIGEPLARHLVSNFHRGPIPTIEQDPEYGIRLLVDIALKAISPAVNDPSTAATCLDYLESLLILASQRRDESKYLALRDEQWIIRHKPVTFKTLLDRACRQLRHYGRTDYAVTVRLLRLLKEVADQTKVIENLKHIEEHARCIYNAVEFKTSPFDKLDPPPFCGDDLAKIKEQFDLVQESIARREAEYQQSRLAGQST